MDAMTDEERFVSAALARENFYFFTRFMFRERRNFPWLRGPHHKMICDHLEAVFDGRIKRLIINIPPRYSKTELAVVNFIAWALGRYPDCEFIHTSYSEHLAENNSWMTREIVAHPSYQFIFPNTQVDRRRNSTDHWVTTAGGVVYAVGANGTITGFGAGKVRPNFGGAILIDDPHKASETRSPTKRRNVIDWYKDTLSSRLNDPKRTPIILIMQRLHEEDLSGFLLGGGSGEEWTHLCLPALREDGTALWPEKHSVEDLERMKRAMPWTYAGQYEQRPSPLDGILFKRAWFADKFVDAAPPDVRWVRHWDLAATKSESGARTAGVKIGRDREGRFYVGHVITAREEGASVRKIIKTAAEIDGKRVTISLPQDPGQAGKVQSQDMVRMLAGYRAYAEPESGDKVTRAEPFAAQCAVGNVYLVRGDWNEAYLEELCTFPNGLKDQVDASSGAFARLIKTRAGLNISDDLVART